MKKKLKVGDRVYIDDEYFQWCNILDIYDVGQYIKLLDGDTIWVAMSAVCDIERIIDHKIFEGISYYSVEQDAIHIIKK